MKSTRPASPSGRYFKYALGEIVLVVIGILIALAINNWNEKRKARAFEVKMLTELKTTLINDMEYIDDHLLGNRNQSELEALDYFKDLLRGASRNKDSLRYHWGRIINGQFFRVNEGPYESIKSIGLEKISNDSLRNDIVRFYDFILPRNRDLIQYLQDKIEEDSKTLKSLRKDHQVIINKDEVFIERPDPNFSLIRTPEFLEIMANTEFRTSWTLYHTKAVTDNMEYLIKKITNELEE
jgi:hypothetical protein